MGGITPGIYAAPGLLIVWQYRQKRGRRAILDAQQSHAEAAESDEAVEVKELKTQVRLDEGGAVIPRCHLLPFTGIPCTPSEPDEA